MVDQNQPPTFDIFSCPLCNNGVYPIYDHDLKIYSSIAAWLKDDLKLQAISKVLSEYTVKLFDSNITTVEKLKFKLENNAHFLVNIGFDAYDAGYISDRLKGVATSSGSGSSSYTGTGGAAPTPPVAPVVRQSHRDLLIKFYRQCNGEKWDKGRNWCSNAALADWHGVSVEPHTENVTKIQLPSNNIVGKLPAEWSGLSTLIKLDLSDNQLTGDCPPSWGALTKLEVLYLRDNILTGTLPAAWSSLVALTALDLNGNELGGVVPQEWDALTSLNACIIYNNYFGTYMYISFLLVRLTVLTLLLLYCVL